MRILTSAHLDIELIGSAHELGELRAELQEFLHQGGELFTAEAEVAFDPSPYDARLTRLVVRRSRTGPMLRSRSSRRLIRKRKRG